MSTIFHYIISGLHVMSDVQLRSALPGNSTVMPDVTIRRVSHLPSEPSPETLLWTIDGVGRFLMQHGTEVLYTPGEGSSAEDLPIYLTGTCFAALLQQRGHTVLHGSAVSVAGKAMLFCGESGAGKSTLAAVLSRRGYPVLSDDICNLHTGADGAVRVVPDGRMLKLWADTLHFLHEEPGGERVRQGHDKFYMVPNAQETDNQEVGAVYLLGLTSSDEAPTVQRLDTAKAMLLVYGTMYRKELVEAMGRQDSYFRMAAALCRQCPVYRLCRPKDLQRMPEILDMLEGSWRLNQ